MKDKETAIGKLKTMRKIIVDHGNVFAPWEAYELVTNFKYVLSYLEKEGKETDE